MRVESPIWPAQLDHLRLNSDAPDVLAEFYAESFGFARSPLPDGTELLQGPGRRLVIGPGAAGERPYHGFRVQSRTQVEDIRDFLEGQGISLEPSPSAIFDEDAVAVRDPDGWLNLFGLPRADLPSNRAVNDRSASRCRAGCSMWWSPRPTCRR